MSGFLAVLKRELKGYFATPVAYVFLVIFLFFAGYLPFRDGFFEIRQADLRLFFTNLPLLFVFMVPSTAMRLWAEERKSGSVELLLTLPITVSQAVLGKFFAAWAFLGIALLLTFPLPAVVVYLGDPDGGQIITGYLGAFLMAGGFLAIGSFFSALTKNQVISFTLSVVACAVLVFAGNPTTLDYLTATMPVSVVTVAESLSFQTHFESIMRGVVEFKDVAYFVILIAAWIGACTLILEERKAN
ncbi:MAG: ABC transporter permease [Planctomycetota bacterium]|jgi:ABC-2 type transport system permease protein